MQKLSEEQKRYLEEAIPWGVLSPEVRWITCDANRWNETLESLTEIGLVTERELAFAEKKPPRGRRKKEIAAQQVRRPVLTTQGMKALVQSLDEDNPLRALNCEHITLRNGKNANAVKRMIISADLQAFLKVCGVDNVYSTVVNHGENAFVFGRPDRILNREKQKTFMDRSLYLLAEYVERNYDTMPLCVDAGDVVLFLPNVANAKSVTHAYLGRSKNVIAATNNTGGLILDCKGKRAYVALRHMGDKPAEWPQRAHLNYQHSFRREMRDWQFRNVGQNKKELQEAFFFCQDQKELVCEIHNKKFQTPFTHVVPIVMNKDGAMTLSKVLKHGIKGYNDLLDAEVVKRVRGAEVMPPDRQSVTCRVAIDGKRSYTGLLFDLNLLHSLAKSVEFGKCPLVTCYEEQAALYHEVVGVPLEKIVVIEREVCTQNP